MSTGKGTRKTGATAAAIAISVLAAAFAANFIFVSAAPFISSVTSAPSETSPVEQVPVATDTNTGNDVPLQSEVNSSARKPSSTTTNGVVSPAQIVAVENKNTPQPTTVPSPTNTTNPPQTTTTTIAPVTTTTRPPAGCGATTGKWGAVQVGMSSAALTAATGCAVAIVTGTIFFPDVGSGDSFRVNLTNGVVTSKTK